MARTSYFSAFERMVAARYLRAPRGEGAVSLIAGFSLLGIALGVGTLIVVLAVMGGFRQELLGRILAVNGHLGVASADESLRDYAAVAERLRALPEVAQATPILEGQVLLTTDAGASAGGLLRGIAPADLRARAIIAGNIRAGSLADFEGEDAIVIGTVLAQRLDVGVGDRITVISPEGRTTVFGTVPRLKPYRVAAIFEVGMQDYDGGFLFLPLPAAQLFLQRPGMVNQIEVHLRDPDGARAGAAAIRQAFAGHQLSIVDWQAANTGFFQIVEVQRNVMFLILALIILVAAFNIISSLIMLVKDKGKDIAILRTMGVGSGAILRIFLLCGAAVGGFGTLAGLGLGLAICTNLETIRQALMRATGTTIFDPQIYFLTRIPAVVDPWDVAQVVGLGFGLSLLATLYPSWRAARTDPVEALRNE
ncbi:lipoprotein-releasing ABC transporter permease subunit [Plastoroseomonas hellenica]|uniref:lipoprotein-releasing ABC transporter permease subunit n=1 Tax=Plastoroseomonas hellenica TaxID=2687306 RepID=UPI001BA9A951|nr:lipoprotein-releasing ABC transporter permease subunit [Plastoroseomonas hellenica]MBR0644284.1 lipoprotein-releasing ABC transporter permease subunit [Plastoroseomonas hellenica]